MGGEVPGKNKYGARRTRVNGLSFASLAEARRYGELRLLEQAGEIQELELQPRFRLTCGGKPVVLGSGRQACYVADFSYRQGGERVVEDVKGKDTRLSALKRALVEAETGVRVILVRY
jgi:hypothetical protein